MASRLVEAVAAGDKAGAYALLQRGQPEWPNQAVSAVERGSVAKRGQLVRMLVLSGADPNCIFSDGLTALHHAAQQDDRETARFLIQQGAYANPAPLPVPQNLNEIKWDDRLAHNNHHEVANDFTTFIAGGFPRLVWQLVDSLMRSLLFVPDKYAAAAVYKLHIAIGLVGNVIHLCGLYLGKTQ